MTTTHLLAGSLDAVLNTTVTIVGIVATTQTAGMKVQRSILDMVVVAQPHALFECPAFEAARGSRGADSDAATLIFLGVGVSSRACV